MSYIKKNMYKASTCTYVDIDVHEINERVNSNMRVHDPGGMAASGESFGQVVTRVTFCKGSTT